MTEQIKIGDKVKVISNYRDKKGKIGTVESFESNYINSNAGYVLIDGDEVNLYLSGPKQEVVKLYSVEDIKSGNYSITCGDVKEAEVIIDIIDPNDNRKYKQYENGFFKTFPIIIWMEGNTFAFDYANCSTSRGYSKTVINFNQ